MDKILEKWDEILQTVKTEHDVSDISFDTWIKPLEVFGVEGNTLYILVPSEQMTLSYISKKYYLPLKVAIAEIIGTEKTLVTPGSKPVPRSAVRPAFSKRSLYAHCHE